MTIHVRVVDVAGKLLLENEEFFVNEGFNSLQLDLRNFRAGMYFLEVKSATDNQIQTFLVNREE